jgi:hypothetical protein
MSFRLDTQLKELAQGEAMTLGVPTAHATQVQYFARFTALGGGGSGTPQTFESGLVQIEELTFQAKASYSDDTDFFIVYDEDDVGWGFWFNVTGGGSEPSGSSEWDQLDEDHKVEVNIQGATTAQQVASEARNSRGNFIATFSDKFSATASVGGVWSTIAIYPNNGYTKANIPTFVAGVTSAVTTQEGTDGQVDIEGDAIKIVAHGYSPNEVVQFTEIGTLPNGITAATDYYIGVVDADVFNLLDSPDGSIIDIGDYGVGENEVAAAGGASVDATILPRGSMYEQGEPDPLWRDQTPVAVDTDGHVQISSLSEWVFAQAQIVITNNSASPLQVEAGLIARG